MSDISTLSPDHIAEDTVTFAGGTPSDAAATGSVGVADAAADRGLYAVCDPDIPACLIFIYLKSRSSVGTTYEFVELVAFNTTAGFDRSFTPKLLSVFDSYI